MAVVYDCGGEYGTLAEVVCCGQEGDALGFVSVYETESFIHHLYVAPNYQGQGVGTALLHSLEAWVPMPWHLKCVERNENTLVFYLPQCCVEESRAQGPGLVANTYPNISLDEPGLKRLFTQFSFPGGIPSHMAAKTPGSINEKKYNAALENK